MSDNNDLKDAIRDLERMLERKLETSRL